MSTDYNNMWKELGLDLDAHNALLEVLNQGYKDIYLSQENRPKSMEYFDFVMSEVHGLRIKELVDAKKEGKKVIGSYCVFVPEELIIAAGGISVGLCAGADFALEEVENYIPRNTCSLVKSAIGFKLGKVCPYLECADLVVGENTCDGKKKAYETLSEMIDDFYVMDLPQIKNNTGKELFSKEIKRFAEKLEELTGNEITADSLKKGIEIVNNKRKALYRLENLRQEKILPISGLDALLINQISFYDDPLRFTDSVNKLCDELEERIKSENSAYPSKRKRILMSGCPMAVPNWKVPFITESLDAVIVGEESCIGERGLRNPVENNSDNRSDLIENIIQRYFKIDCAVFTPNKERKDHILEMAKKYKADGVILYGLNFCQPYTIEAFSLEKELEKNNLPAIKIETDYSQEDMGQLQTRIEAFVEMI
ncbi:MAG: 2-hydroxyacyl-CoA dehydratase [Desulfobacteraceae bacterium]|nr:2-hydroxyacyl-CoA dehydratase [Desulfobacteraceae bacterium]